MRLARRSPLALLGLPLVLGALSCGGARPSRADYLIDTRTPSLLQVRYTTSVRRGIDRTVGGLVAVRSYEDRPVDVEVLCVALPEEDGTIRRDVAAVLRSAPIHVEPQSESALSEVVFSTALPAHPGLYQVDCGVRRVGETGLFVFPGIANGALQSFAVRAPNLHLGVARSLADVFDCETEALPVRGRPICVQPVIAESEQATEMLSPELDRHTLRCELEGRVVEATLESLRDVPPLRFPDTSDLSPGAHDVRCVIDPGDVLAESDESDNEGIVSTTVLADVACWASTIRVEPAEVNATYVRASGETGSPAHWRFAVRFHLDGHPLRAATVACGALDGLSATGGFGMGGLPENLVLPGDHEVSVTIADLSSGEHRFDCTLATIRPASVRADVRGAEITVRVRE